MRKGKLKQEAIIENCSKFTKRNIPKRINVIMRRAFKFTKKKY